MKPRVLKLATDDPDAERAFAVAWMVSMTEEQRVKLVVEGSRVLREGMRKNGRPLVPRVLKRP